MTRTSNSRLVGAAVAKHKLDGQPKLRESNRAADAAVHGRSYGACPVKPSRRRATKGEMEDRAEFLIAYAEEHGPVTVRGLYYQAEVHGIPGIDKTDAGYAKVQRQVLSLRREGRLSYDDIADATRWMRKPRSHSNVESALDDTARLYRKNLWNESATYVEIWLEKDALAGVIYPVTARYDVPLMITRGFSSETFCYEAVAARKGDDRPYQIYHLGDYDRAGQDAAGALRRTLERHAEDAGVAVIFESIALTLNQIAFLGLHIREPKRSSPADKRWPHNFCCELDAIPPDTMREIVEDHINLHLDRDRLRVLLAAEESERRLLETFAAKARSAP